MYEKNLLAHKNLLLSCERKNMKTASEEIYHDVYCNI